MSATVKWLYPELQPPPRLLQGNRRVWTSEQQQPKYVVGLDEIPQDLDVQQVLDLVFSSSIPPEYPGWTTTCILSRIEGIFSKVRGYDGFGDLKGYRY